MKHFRGLWTLGLLSLLLCSWSAPAQTWQNDRYHVSMQTPTDWPAMSKALLAQTNAQISHVTGRGFIAGYALNETDTLVFPYMLVQFKPYTALPEQVRPQAKLDERGRLELLYEMVGAFQQRGPLPETIDTPQFTDRFGNDIARLTRLEDDGRFDFTGKIPHEVGQDPIRYHTHGIFGKDGIAMVSVFTIEDFSGLTYVIQNEMRTLAFDQGFGGDALPDEPAIPEANTEPIAEPTDQSTQPTEAQPAPEVEETTAKPEADPAVNEPDEPIVPLNPATGHADSTALILILSLLGAALFAAALIAWFVAHQKAQAQRERKRARLERLHANQSAAQIPPQPRPAQPPTAQARGSNDRQRRGTTRS